MPLGILFSFYSDSTRLPTLRITSEVFWMIPQQIPVDQSTMSQLSSEEKAIVRSGVGRPDKVLALLSRYVQVSEKEMDILRMGVLAWVNTLDMKTIESQRLFAEAFPVICLGGIVSIKVTQAEGKLRMSGEEEKQGGKLQFWTTFNNGTGVCALDTRNEDIHFHIDDLVSDITIIELVRKPEWFSMINPLWGP